MMKIFTPIERFPPTLKLVRPGCFTIARSANDEYTPADVVEELQRSVVDDVIRPLFELQQPPPRIQSVNATEADVGRSSRSIYDTPLAMHSVASANINACGTTSIIDTSGKKIESLHKPSADTVKHHHKALTVKVQVVLT